MLATTPAGTNVANTLYTHARPAPTVTRISGIGHHAWRHFGGDHRHYPTGAKAATVGATAAVTVVGERDEVSRWKASTRPRGRRPRHGGDDRHQADQGAAVAVGAVGGGHDNFAVNDRGPAPICQASLATFLKR